MGGGAGQGPASRPTSASGSAWRRCATPTASRRSKRDQYWPKEVPRSPYPDVCFFSGCTAAYRMQRPSQGRGHRDAPRRPEAEHPGRGRMVLHLPGPEDRSDQAYRWIRGEQHHQGGAHGRQVHGHDLRRVLQDHLARLWQILCQRTVPGDALRPDQQPAHQGQEAQVHQGDQGQGHLP